MSNNDAKLTELFKKVNPLPNTAPLKTWVIPLSTEPVFQERSSNKYVNSNIIKKFSKVEEPADTLNEPYPFDTQQMLTGITVSTENVIYKFQNYEYSKYKSKCGNPLFLSTRKHGGTFWFNSKDHSKTLATVEILEKTLNHVYKMVKISGKYAASEIHKLLELFKDTEHLDLTEVLILESPFMLNQLINMLPIKLYGISIDASHFTGGNFHDDVQQLCNITFDSRKLKNVLLYTTGICSPEDLKTLINQSNVFLKGIHTVTIVTDALICKDIVASLITIKFAYTKSLTSSHYGSPEEFCVFSKTTCFKYATNSTLSLALRLTRSSN